MKDVKWIDGAPKELGPGMILRGRGESLPLIWLVGSSIDDRDFDFAVSCEAWAWLIQPHEVDWLKSMAKAHKVGRPAEGEGK